jgi:hypothetical protein
LNCANGESIQEFAAEEQFIRCRNELHRNSNEGNNQSNDQCISSTNVIGNLA